MGVWGGEGRLKQRRETQEGHRWKAAPALNPQLPPCPFFLQLTGPHFVSKGGGWCWVSE